MDGTPVYDANGTAFVDTGLTNDIEYRYAAFAHPPDPWYTTAIIAATTPADVLPPPSILHLSSTAVDS